MKRIVLFVTIAMMLAGCGTIFAPKKELVKADYDVEVTDPNIKRLTEVTSNIKLVASGEFTPGTYIIGKMPVSIPPQTKFELNIAVPVANPSVISTHDATGTLTVSREISVMAVPVPLNISLHHGTVSGEVDLVRGLSAFFVNILQVGVISGDTRQMIKHMKIEKAELNFRPNAEIKIGPKVIQVGPDSKVTLSNVLIDSQLNYQADCLMKLNFAKNCNWLGERVDAEFEGGHANVIGRAVKQGNQLTISIPANSTKPQQIVMKKSKFRFGKFKRSSAISDECILNLKEFSLRHTTGIKDDSMHLLSGMDLTGTNLKLKTDIHQTLAYFPGKVPATLQVDLTPEESSTHFGTDGSATAKTGLITIAKKATSLSLHLEDTTIGQISYDKFGALAFMLEKGTSKLKQIDWQGNKSKFTLTTSGASTLTLPSNMVLEKDTNGPTKLDLPLRLDLARAALKMPQGTVEVSDVKGNLHLDVDREIQLSSNMDFTVQRSKLLGSEAADVKVRGIDLSLINKRANLHLKSCSVILPEKTLADAISKRVPDHLDLTLNKIIQEEKKWRYRNAKAVVVKVDNLKITEMRPLGAGKLNFTASGEVAVEGTIEKCGLIFKTDTWKECPWTLKADVTGQGLVKYSITGDTNNVKSKLKYDLSMSLPLPDDMKLDWSKVADGLLRIAERRAIIKHLKKITVPIAHQGEINMYEHEDSRWRNFKLSKVAMKSKGSDISIDFTADAVF
ncbi:MAG: hypothetical protein IAF58_10040 [Leptolyngbya sp.]|nr:hypothetical protein [Candidatus Melainabacteria bacterium]